MSMAVQIWWVILCVVAVLNIAAWTMSAKVLARRYEHFFSAAQHRQRRLLSWLSAAYVAGCAFRSFLPRIDLERICLVQSGLSNMMVGRSVATVAELCFMAQCALLMHQAGRSTDNRFVVTVSVLLIPLIVVAEGASWYAILSTNYLGHVVENSIWTFCAVLLLASFVALWSHSQRQQRYFLAAMMVFAIGYIAFMTRIDVPMYWSRWSAEVMAGATYLSLTQGILDAARPCVVSFDWDIWREEIPWMTLYFTVAVWVSISLAHVPGWVNGSNARKAASTPVASA
jgi:hypothetical protein